MPPIPMNEQKSTDKIHFLTIYILTSIVSDLWNGMSIT